MLDDQLILMCQKKKKKNENVECVKGETSTTEEDVSSLLVGFYHCSGQICGNVELAIFEMSTNKIWK